MLKSYFSTGDNKFNAGNPENLPLALEQENQKMFSKFCNKKWNQFSHLIMKNSLSIRQVSDLDRLRATEFKLLRFSHGERKPSVVRHPQTHTHMPLYTFAILPTR